MRVKKIDAFVIGTMTRSLLPNFTFLVQESLLLPAPPQLRLLTDDNHHHGFVKMKAAEKR